MSIVAVEAALEQRLQAMPNAPPIAWEDVSGVPDNDAVRLRRELEARHRRVLRVPAMAEQEETR